MAWCSTSLFHFVDRVRTPVEGLVDAGAEPVFAFYLENQVDDKLTIGGVNSAHYTGDFAYTNLESTSYWQINLDGLKLNGAAVGSTPYAIVDSGTSFWAKTHHGREVNCCLVELVDHHRSWSNTCGLDMFCSDKTGTLTQYITNIESEFPWWETSEKNCCRLHCWLRSRPNTQ